MIRLKIFFSKNKIHLIISHKELRQKIKIWTNILKLLLNYSISFNPKNKISLSKSYTFFFLSCFVNLFLISNLLANDPEDFLYVKNFTIGKLGGVTSSSTELLRKEFLESLQKIKKFKLVGPEAEEAIRTEQSKIEEEGGSGMMCRADECRRRLLRVSSADILAEGTVEKVAEDLNEIQLEVFSRRIISYVSGEKKEQSVNVYSVKFKIFKNEKDNLRMLSLAGSVLAKKVSGIPVSSEEEDQVSGLKPLGRDNLDNLARSMILPGWGQHTKEHFEKAYLFYALTVFGAAKCVQDWQNYRITSKNYSNSVGGGFLFSSILQGDFEVLSLYYVSIYPKNFRDENKTAIKTYNNSLAGVGIFYTVNLLDAYFSNKRYFLGKEEGLSFEFNINPFNPNNLNYNIDSNKTGISGEYSIWLNYRF